MSDPVLAACRTLAPNIRGLADRTEAERRVPAALVEELARAGCFRMLVPRAFGGVETDPADFVRVIEEVAAADGSTGWCVMVGATTGLVAAYLEEEGAREVWAADRDVVCSGVFAPFGKAVEVDGGYRVSGRWPFASGSENASWRMGGALVLDGDKPRLGADGAPVVEHLLLRAEETQILDTWNVSGLRGTGSHDMVARDVFVPRRRVVSLVTGRPRHDGALYAFPLFGLLALGIAAAALGIARSAMESFRELATSKRSAGGARTLAQREMIQTQVAQAAAQIGAARAFVFDAAAQASAATSPGTMLSARERANVRLAATHAAVACAHAVDTLYSAAGGSAIYASCPLQRHFRDVHVATQHILVAQTTWTLAGRILLGLETDANVL